MLRAFKIFKINFQFDPEKNENRKKILSLLNKGISGDLMNSDHAGNIGPTQKTYYFKFIKKLLMLENKMYFDEMVFYS